MKKALMKTSVKILVLGLALTAMLFGCKQPSGSSGSSNSAGSGGGNGSESGKYSITYHLDGGTNNVDNPASYTKNDEFPLRAPSKEGQVFDGWFGNSEFSGEAVTKITKGTTGKKEFWAKWVAESESAAYTVKHLQQNADDDGYTQKETESLKGGKGSKTLAVAKQYEGFTAQAITQQTINEDGSTVVEIKYDRKMITLTLDLDGGTISPAIPDNKITGKFGAAVTKPADPSKDGNRFSGWVPEIPAEFSKDSTHTAQWTINITVNIGDERIESYTGPELSNKKPGVKWSDIKPSDETIKLKPEWQGGDYGLYEWRLNDENGQKIDDDYTFTKDTTVYAVTNYLKFKTETENGELCISENKGYTGEAPRGKIIIPAGTENNPMVAIGKYAFYGCTFLQFGKKIDVPNLRCVRSLESMFGDCEMFNQPIENWDVSTIESMERMFVRAYAFNQPLNGWNVSNVTTMETMFWGARSFNQPLDRWDVRKVRSMKYMFSYATSFDQELGMWKLKRCETLSLRYCGMSVENYSKSLATWAAQTGNSKALLLQADGLKYDERGETARTELVQKRKWIIEGDSAL